MEGFRSYTPEGAEAVAWGDPNPGPGGVLRRYTDQLVERWKAFFAQENVCQEIVLNQVGSTWLCLN